jgi:hypothetical protein
LISSDYVFRDVGELIDLYFSPLLD